MPLSKKNKKPLQDIRKADELKVIIESAEDFKWAEYNRKQTGEKCLLFAAGVEQDESGDAANS